MINSLMSQQLPFIIHTAQKEINKMIIRKVKKKGWVARLIITLLLAILTVIYATNSFAEDGFTQQDRELLIELKVKMTEIDKRFEQVDERFDQVNLKFTELRQDMNNRFGDVNNRFDDMFNYLLIIATTFTALTITTISLVFWDRKTIIGKAKKETIEEIEKNGLSTKLLSALRQLAKDDKGLAEVLKQFNLL